MRVNVANSGGPGVGKSVLAAVLFADLKILGLDYDLIPEERRKLMCEMGNYRSPFERIYMWRQQEREELRSSAADGFITDTPLFHLYTQGKWYACESRDILAVRELLRMCLELKASGRYQIITIPKNPEEIPYKTDSVRTSDESDARMKHALIRSFVEHFFPDKILFVHGSAKERAAQVICRILELRGEKE